ncbi:MAG: DUF6146 family protein [Bacteroidota bacterium]
MRRILVIIGIVIFVYACSTQKGAVQVNKNEPDIAVPDSLEYDLETFDVKFETWYQMHNNPSMYRSQQYYENWNRQYVSAWNHKAIHSSKRGFFEPIVGYDPNEDYGFELNHELFYYFQYVENVLKIKILQGGPKAVNF